MMLHFCDRACAKATRPHPPAGAIYVPRLARPWFVLRACPGALTPSGGSASKSTVDPRHPPMAVTAVEMETTALAKRGGEDGDADDDNAAPASEKNAQTVALTAVTRAMTRTTTWTKWKGRWGGGGRWRWPREAPALPAPPQATTAVAAAVAAAVTVRDEDPGAALAAEARAATGCVIRPGDVT